MKLYTEEQVIKLTKAAFTSGLNHNSFIFGEELKNITPIEIPSDEDIEDESLEENNDDLSPAEEFQRGAKYVINKIQGGNKQECQFEIDNSTSSATKCKFCDKEKWQHPNLNYTGQ